MDTHTGDADDTMVRRYSMLAAASELGFPNAAEEYGNDEVEQTQDSIPPGQPDPASAESSDSDSLDIIVIPRF